MCVLQPETMEPTVLAEPLSAPLSINMATFLYCCPTSGLRVQGWIADDPMEDRVERFEAVTRLACTRVHIVNPKTGKLLGEDDE